MDKTIKSIEFEEPGVILDDPLADIKTVHDDEIQIVFDEYIAATTVKDKLRTVANLEFLANIALQDIAHNYEFE